MAERILEEKGLVVRHSLVELIEHWAIALSGLTLLLSGFFQMPTANRYYFTSVPGFSWSGDFIASLNVHYAASVIFIAAALFHIIYHWMLDEKGMIPQKGDMSASIQVIRSFFGKGEEPPFHKYLPEQRLAYVGMAAVIAMLILSGLVKTYKNIYAPDMPLAVVLTATWIHNIGFLLFLMAFFAHMAAIVLKPNRPMIRAIFTGAVRLDYARHRHPLWMADLETPDAISAAVQEAPAVSSDQTDEALRDNNIAETDTDAASAGAEENLRPENKTDETAPLPENGNDRVR